MATANTGDPKKALRNSVRGGKNAAKGKIVRTMEIERRFSWSDSTSPNR
jgi:hypothetical protein